MGVVYPQIVAVQPTEDGSNVNMIIVCDPSTYEAWMAFMGREAHPSGRDAAIQHIKPCLPDAPGRFEWHPQKRKVYLIRHSHPAHAEVIAEHAETAGHAFGFVQTWMRGYREGTIPGPKPHLLG